MNLQFEEEKSDLKASTIFFFFFFLNEQKCDCEVMVLQDWLGT
tara:strand:+ start:324 stop:452 length:129 start_codon:yes stop_codon:yes gene_type:complete